MKVQLKKQHSKYSMYKHTGIPWLGEVPEGWNVLPLKRIVMPKITDGPHTTPSFVDEGIPFISVEAINADGSINFEHRRGNIETALHREYCKKCKPKKNDILLVKSGSTTGKTALVKVDFDFSIWSPLALIRANKKMLDFHFLYFYLQSLDFQRQVQLFWTFGTQPNIGMGSLEKLNVIFPSIDEQKKISILLGSNIAIIDSIILKKQKQIELLKEKRSALINRAVTKGIDNGVEMKDSGVQWIGKIPKHWQEKPLFACAYEKKVKNIGNKIDKVLSLSYGQIVIRDVESNFGLLPESFETYQIVDPGDVILRLTDLQNDKKSLRVGLVKEVGIITSAYVCLRAKASLLHDYFYELLHSYDIEKVFYSLGAGVRETMKFGDLKRLSVLIPPEEEQDRITHFIINETEKIDSAIVRIGRSLNLLHEYKNSLISNVITGRIKII